MGHHLKSGCPALFGLSSILLVLLMFLSIVIPVPQNRGNATLSRWRFTSVPRKRQSYWHVICFLHTPFVLAQKSVTFGGLTAGLPLIVLIGRPGGLVSAAYRSSGSPKVMISHPKSHLQATYFSNHDKPVMTTLCALPLIAVPNYGGLP